MKTILKILTSISILAMLSTSSLASDSYAEVSLGMSSVKKSDGKKENTTDLTYSFLFGDKIKYGGGFGYHLMKKDTKNASGNYIDFDIKVGYEPFKDLVGYVLVGYAFQDIGDFTYKGKTDDVMSKGLGYGLGFSYYFTRRIGLKAEYRKYSMDFDIAKYKVDYDLDATLVALSFKF